jgi:hypothetical protein
VVTCVVVLVLGTTVDVGTVVITTVLVVDAVATVVAL